MNIFSKLFNRNKRYKASDFSRSRLYNNQTQHYHDDTNQWIFLYLILNSLENIFILLTFYNGIVAVFLRRKVLAFCGIELGLNR